MGDLIEITTRPLERSKYYKVPSGGLKVYIKTDSGSPAIGLAEKKDDVCEYWIVLDYQRHTWIKKKDVYSQVVHTPNILSPDEYRCFWVMWDGLCVKLGKDGETDPICSFSDSTARRLNYVSFAVKHGDNPVHWRLEIRPIIPKLDFRPITGGEVRWVSANDQLPEGALIGGYENGALYIMRAEHNGSLTPGKFVPSEGVGYIPWGTQAHEKRIFEILVGFNCTWVHTREDKIPVGAIVGGYSENMIDKLYIGRARHRGHLIPGKVQPSHAVCYIPYEGREIRHRAYEILVGPESNKHCLKHIWTLMVQHCLKMNVRRRRIRSNNMITGRPHIISPTLFYVERTEDEEDSS